MPIEMPRGLPFSVDTWTPSSQSKRHHFLTHAHRDHTHNLSIGPTNPIYCTNLTKNLLLLHHHHHHHHVERLVFVEIEVGERIIVDDPDGDFSVLAFDANHCPGAVMFLFEGDFGNILHTGDCRLTPECLQKLPPKYIPKKGRETNSCLDYVFLDCTFGRHSLKIPSKHSAIEQVINCIWKHPNAPVIYLACDLLGQEEILVEVSKTFGSKIYIDQMKHAGFFQALTLIAPNIITQDPASRFQLFEGFPKLYEKASIKLAEARLNIEPEPLFIRPSSQWYALEEQVQAERPKKLKYTEAQRDQFGVWHVCYSMHSSREELEWALQLLQPKWVVSTTPPCRAMDLDYVRKHCSLSKLSADACVWKLLDIDIERSTSPRTSAISAVLETRFDTPSECRELEVRDVSVNISEARLNLSPPSKKGSITLFGKARLGVQAFSILNEEKREVAVKVNPLPGATYEKEPLSSLREDEVAQLQPKESSECKEYETEKDDSTFMGSSKSYNSSLRRWYRSMNVPVPQPLPSLVSLASSCKRVKASSASGYTHSYCFDPQ
ncbi:hypothetical protein QJS04_geneDACA009249 [Acorus gramineus]|uniref:DNA repair metallo-beta-lactamase domain-containing protein n=1 Tax=Acorus gramineus TaxID=55184 RepID=A0AAV9AFC5_ACOGR|nr:hypothetical protein QJS04_geneDACA009249 [Acorus gramineus]